MGRLTVAEVSAEAADAAVRVRLEVGAEREVLERRADDAHDLLEPEDLLPRPKAPAQVQRAQALHGVALLEETQEDVGEEALRLEVDDRREAEVVERRVETRVFVPEDGRGEAQALDVLEEREEAEEQVVVPVEVPFGDVARLYGEPLEGADHVRWGGEGCGGVVDDVHSTQLELLEPRH